MQGKQAGFTLIEIAIVLVIIGLLLGGVLKGQELITSARVRNLISQQDGIKAAYFGFLDRYRALPGDYNAAATTIAGVAVNGDADGQVELNNGANLEHILVWDHLSHAGFVTGSYTYNALGPNNNTNPTNPYGSFLQVIFDSVYQDAAPTNRHNLKTGSGIPSDILAEVDRKIDDGRADQGVFRYSAYAGAAAGSGTCFVLATGLWATGGALPPNSNCGGVSLF